MIDKFDGDYRFLSNFYDDRPFMFEGIMYRNSEAAFHAQKTFSPYIKMEMSNMNPSEAKKYGRRIQLRKDWEDVKFDIMKNICRAKFQDEILAQKLLETENEMLVEGNTWHDNTWGSCSCPKCKNKKGKNWLGIILMDIRTELISKKKELETVKSKVDYIIDNGNQDEMTTAMELEELIKKAKNPLSKQFLINNVNELCRTIEERTGVART